MTHTGLRPWLWQRASALYLAGYLGYLLFHLSCTGVWADHAQWRAFMGAPLHSAAAALAAVLVALHAWIGLRDISMDYIPCLALRLLVRGLLGLALAASVWWVLGALARL